MATYNDIVNQIKNRDLRPVYVLHGEEGFFIDRLVHEFETTVVDEADRDFNQYVLYAPQLTPEAIMDTARRVPMMSPLQLVVVKEVQSMRADQVSRLAGYLHHPSPTTVMVICFRGEKAKGKEFLAAMRKNKNVESFESPKIKDYQMSGHITSCLSARQLSADDRTIAMLLDHIGSDLSRLYNEVDKLAQLLPPGSRVTPDIVQQNIGVSKEYNSFELTDAIATRDAAKALRIAAYFRSNPKSAPLQQTLPLIFALFRNALIAIYSPDQSDRGLMEVLGFKSSYQLRTVAAVRRNYNGRKIVACIDAIRKFDAQSKGIGSRQDAHLLFQDLLNFILN